ncbi:auxin-induced in root cultures protein 12-like [Phoenix dactylifera]|uniref:Auxin-induced in root cultures protein 12 n=1 Tax=Phoenix dactylifera TaxID=42345 RepID=A0A8B9A5V6_PHODC|nr:auxin-induced in root cultures protein 12 [Phoenix dactylifera]XP_038978649.1 auxin-induced in root cultures protein 12-like [Phoenix dactylifera]
MAAAFVLLSVAIAAVCFLPPPVAAQACKSQNLGANRVFADCSDLPHLSASLHWTYNSTAGALSIAFMAPPAAQGGWVAWAINPTGTGMAGSQTLAAFKGADGKMVVKTYNITGYEPLKESKIAFDTADLAAEYTNGTIRLFGTVKVGKDMKAVNQVWQVGASVKDGVPVKHAFDPDNLAAKGTLTLAQAVSPAPQESGAGKRNLSNLLYFVMFLFLLF